MRDHDDRDAELAVDALQKRKRGGRRFRVEGRGSFVGEKHLRVVRKGARDADALLLAARELRGILVGVLGETHEFDQGRDLFADLPFGDAREFERKRDVAVDRARGEQVEVLEDHADRTAGFTEFRFREVGENLAVYDDVPRRGTVEKIDAAHERALPGARAPDDAEDFARTDFERNVLERIKGLPFGRRVGLRDVLEFDHVLSAERVSGQCRRGAAASRRVRPDFSSFLAVLPRRSRLRGRRKEKARRRTLCDGPDVVGT